MKKRMGAALALMAGMAATSAQAATTPCLTRSEATGLFTALLPDMLQGFGKACMTALPQDAALRGGLPATVARYQAASDGAWPQAMAALHKLSGTDMSGLDPKLLRPMMGPIVGNMMAQDIKPADCPAIDRAVTLLAPLPAGSLAELIMIAADAGMRDAKDAPFTICRAEQALLPPAGPGMAAR